MVWGGALLGLDIEVLAQEQVLEGLVLAKGGHQCQEVRVKPWPVDGRGLALGRGSQDLLSASPPRSRPCPHLAPRKKTPPLTIV